MLSYLNNPGHYKDIMSIIPRQLFLVELNVYIYLIFLGLYYTLLEPNDIIINNSDEDYVITPLDYIYFTAIIHSTVGFGDITINSKIGKILKTLHSLIIMTFFIIFFS